MEIIASNQGKNKLCYNGHLYVQKNSKKDWIRWVCIRNRSGGCKGALTSNATYENPRSFVEHNHEADEMVIEVAKVRTKMKILAQNLNVTPNEVIAQCLQDVPEDVRARLGNLETCKRDVRRQKNLSLTQWAHNHEFIDYNSGLTIMDFWTTTVTESNYLQNSGPLPKFAKVTLNSTQNGTQVQSSRLGQPSIHQTSRTYVQQSISNPVASRPQQSLVVTRQQVKPPTNQVTNFIQNQNSLQRSARTQEEQHQITVRNLSNSVSSVTRKKMPNQSQIILPDTLQQEQDNQNFIPRSSNFIRQNNQSTRCGPSVSSNSLNAEKSILDDSTLPMDYEKFFEEASKLPRMGCDVFVLVSYPGCKPAYWGTEKYVRKFENSERLLPFSESGCLSIKLSGVADKQNLLANNLDLLSDNSGTEIFIKDEPMENTDNTLVAHDDIKQEYVNVEDQNSFARNRRTRMKVTTQKSDNSSLEARNTGSQNNNSLRGNRQYTKQLNTNTQYGGSNTYGFSTKNANWHGSRPSHRDNEVTNYYDTGDGIIKIKPGMNEEHFSADESALRLESEISEPSEVLIKIEPQTADYGEVDRLVYTEYG